MREEILELLKRMKGDADFEHSEDFIADGLIDSFEIVDLVAEMEERFSIEISGRDIIPENFVNLEAMDTMIQKYTEGM